MLAILGLLSLVASIVLLVIAIISAIRKTGNAKIQFIITGALFAIFVVALALTPPTEDTENLTNKSASASESKVIDTTQKDSDTDQEKADQKEEEKARKKAEKEAEELAKKEAEEKKKAEAEAKKKAEEEAKKKAQEEKIKNPDWNTSEVDAIENGNILLAFEMIRAIGTIPDGEYEDPEAVLKTPWNYYGSPITFSGYVAVVEDYPPDSSEIASDIVIETYEGTIVEFFSMVPSGNIKVGDDVTITGYPVGRTEVPNRLGGSFTHLIIVTNDVDQ